jgi:hypothetical protein
MMTDTEWRWFKHPVTLSVQRVRVDDEAYIKLLLRWTWEEIDEPDDWVKP